MESVVFIESNTSGTGKLFIEKSIKLGYKPIFFTQNNNLYSFLDELAGIEIVHCNTYSETEVLECCNKITTKGFSIKGVISTSEYYISMASKIAFKLGLPCPNAESIKTCRNKFLQNKALEDIGLNVPKAIIIEESSIVDSSISQFSFPVIIKPIEGSGSVGVKLCDSINELKEQINILLRQKKNERGISVDNRVLVEEYIQGVEYSAEVFNGKVIGVTKKYLSSLPFFIETGHDYPAILSTEVLAVIERDVSKAVQALNLEWGACHVEVRIHNNNVYFIEINPRLAGGFIPELVKYATGIDLIENQLRMVLGLSVNLIKSINGRIGIRFFIPPKSGYIESYDSIEKLKKRGILDIRKYKAVDELIVLNGDFRDRVGHIIFDINEVDLNSLNAAISNFPIIKEATDERYRKN